MKLATLRSSSTTSTRIARSRIPPGRRGRKRGSAPRAPAARGREERPCSSQWRRVGLATHLYEVTNTILSDWRVAAGRYVRLFGLDPARFSPIKSERFGYVGTLTLFDPPQRLDRIEISQVNDPASAMGRWVARHADSLYTCLSRNRRRARHHRAPCRARRALHPARDRRSRGARRALDTPSALRPAAGRVADVGGVGVVGAARAGDLTDTAGRGQLDRHLAQRCRRGH